MKIIPPKIKFRWLSPSPLEAIESAARTCYKSEQRISPGSAEKLISFLIAHKHEAMLEHASASYKITCDRAIANEIVRHRLFSFAQESSRYVNYKNKGAEFVDIRRKFKYNTSQLVWERVMEECSKAYNTLVREGESPELSRSVLPNSLKTELIVTGNFREWRHFLKLRTSKAAHPQMQEVAEMLLEDLKNRVSVIFADI